MKHLNYGGGELTNEGVVKSFKEAAEFIEKMSNDDNLSQSDYTTLTTLSSMVWAVITGNVDTESLAKALTGIR